MRDVITVSALNRYVKTLLDADDALFDLALRGEVTNFVCNARSGHCYFSLRDDQCSVKAVMFRREAQRLAFRPQDGMRVVVRCRVTLYEQAGAFQVYVNDMFPDGLGSAQLALEQLKQKLYAEGLFDQAHKQPIPACPQWIGVVTSKTGAALQDIRNVIGRRWPLARLLLCPVSVQGVEAPRQIAAAIRRLDADGRPDVILVARGGGSREDLWVFNAECIARAAFACRTPLISAIGHEIDTTLLDYVADLRAPTPSAAAEMAVPDQQAVRQRICSNWEKMHEIMQTRLQVCYNTVTMQRRALAEASAAGRLAAGRTRLDGLRTQLQAAAARRTGEAHARLAQQAALMASLDPYRTLARGYTMPLSLSGTPLPADRLQPGRRFVLQGDAFRVRCLVETREESRADENAQEL